VAQKASAQTKENRRCQSETLENEKSLTPDKKAAAAYLAVAVAWLVGMLFPLDWHRRLPNRDTLLALSTWVISLIALAISFYVMARR